MKCDCVSDGNIEQKQRAPFRMSVCPDSWLVDTNKSQQLACVVKQCTVRHTSVSK